MMKVNRKVIIGVLVIVVLTAITLSTGAVWYIKRKDSSIETSPIPTTTLTATPTESVSPSPSESTTPTASITVTITPTLTPTPIKTPAVSKVLIYFSKNPESYDSPTYVVSVTRTTTRVDIGTFAIEQLIAGPTPEEAKIGLFSSLSLSGSSNCNGKNFTLNVDSNKKATLKFCRIYMSPGTLADARIINTIDKTLKQFPTINKLIILTYDNHCFGDLSGLDICKGI